jgi:hypothetical protein
VCDKTCIFFFFPIINKYLLYGKTFFTYGTTFVERECVEKKINYASVSLYWLSVKMARDSVETKG